MNSDLVGTAWRRLPPAERTDALYQITLRCDIPSLTAETLAAFIATGRPTGGFLEAVLTNNLKEACNRADDENKHRLWDIVYFLYNHAPRMCWGSDELILAWMTGHGFNGLEERIKAEEHLRVVDEEEQKRDDAEV